jgi:mannitol/fructose-specific phosphotransferase system IIA component (Ntr-type)
MKESHVVLDLEPGDKAGVLRNFVEKLRKRGLIKVETDILKGLLEREKLGSTGLENGIAIPHALIDGLAEPFLGLAVIREGTDFEALDQKPTYVLLLLLGNSDKPGTQLKILAHICRLIKETDVIRRIRGCADPRDVCRSFEEEEEKII